MPSLGTSAGPHVFCGTGDNLWNHKVEPVDSPATLTALCQWITGTHQARRLYWRGGQDDLWHRDFRRVAHDPLITDWVEWERHLYEERKLNHVAVAAAKAEGLEVYLYTGLFEHGVQPDIGIVHPHVYEDILRKDHPEWCPLDRWLQRRGPGPVCLGYPEVRTRIVERLMDQLERFGYDGLIFYTYVENLGLRYENEFGFNPPIAEEFHKTYPDIDLERELLTPEQLAHWQKCQGKFVTDFLTELRTRMSPRNKKLGVILDAREPDFPQKWWGKSLHGTGKIFLEWEKWIADGLVDEIWVQLGERDAQMALLDRLLMTCAGKAIELTVRTPEPYAEAWIPYKDNGVTPVAVITWENNGIEKLTLEPTRNDSLRSSDWKVRAQALSDLGQKARTLPASPFAPLLSDPAVLVRHRLPRALSRCSGPEAVPLLERLLTDPESSVRIAAVDALGSLSGPETATRILQALARGERFQFKLVAVSTLTALGNEAAALLLDHLHHPEAAVVEVSLRVLGNLGQDGDSPIHEALRHRLLDQKSDQVLRIWALKSLGQIFQRSHPGCSHPLRAFPNDLMTLIDEDETPGGEDLQLHAVEALKSWPEKIASADRSHLLNVLTKAFRRYGDASRRTDAAYGWRVVGNAILAYQGRDILEEMRVQTNDKWLAWNAYETVYLFHDLPPHCEFPSFNAVDERQAMEDHNRFAPEFPGWRTW